MAERIIDAGQFQRDRASRFGAGDFPKPHPETRFPFLDGCCRRRIEGEHIAPGHLGVDQVGQVGTEVATHHARPNRRIQDFPDRLLRVIPISQGSAGFGVDAG